ncbi:hypothetical protein EI77_04651 [Prosthecobacter fusiformis]|uniref:Uncharacterized protein n=1 Tax=Prosthecobacter fusiformis TaxID=48464 RepID=A0A4R7RJI9_9BACT|nr:hypothetical protein [Prosthecobacter fusiformis]TDU62549.1 hypothetical protein EI77_04651 [Prosthecobacter fusiformis]
MNSPDKAFARVRIYENGMFIFDGQDWTREVIIQEDPFQQRLFDNILKRLNSEWAHHQIFSGFIGFAEKMEKMLNAAGIIIDDIKIEEMYVPSVEEEPGHFY